MSTISKRELASNEENELRRGPWTLEEDSLLIHYIARHGEGRWNMLAKSAGTYSLYPFNVRGINKFIPHCFCLNNIEFQLFRIEEDWQKLQAQMAELLET